MKFKHLILRKAELATHSYLQSKETFFKNHKKYIHRRFAYDSANLAEARSRTRKKRRSNMSVDRLWQLV